MAERKMHRKEEKKAPQKNIKEKRKEKKDKTGKGGNIPT